MLWRRLVLLVVVLFSLMAVGLVVSGWVGYIVKYNNQEAANKKTGMLNFSFSLQPENKTAKEVYGIVLWQGKSGMWLRTYEGLRFFKPNEGMSVYYFHNICSSENLDKLKNGKDVTFSPNENRWFTYSLWLKNAQVGNFVRLSYFEKNGVKNYIDKLTGFDVRMNVLAANSGVCF